MTYIIAEIGVNHNGEIKLAEKLISLAKAAGANAVKFQCFNADKLARKNTPKTQYQIQNDSINRSHYEMLKNLELRQEEFVKLSNMSKKLGLDFIVTPYGIEDIEILKNVGIDKLKIASADLTDKSLIKSACSTGLPLILSTGMSSLSEIERTCKTIKTFKDVDYSLLHCTSSYPATYESLNIKAINALKTYSEKIGYSDHSIDGFGSFMAVVLGAKILERHITIDKKMKGPDHHCSDDFADFEKYVRQVRLINKALGDGIKTPHFTEEDMKNVSRKSAYLRVDVKKGSYVNLKDFLFQRPGGGFNEYEIDELILKRSTYSKNFNKGSKFE